MSINKKIKILIVDDSAIVRDILSSGLSKEPSFEIVGSAPDPFVARDMIIEHRPDVITLDIEMPRMNGLEFLARLMPQFPLPVIMVSSLTQKGANETFRALELGALDFIPKPQGGNPNELSEMLTELATKIKIASTVDVSRFKKAISTSNTNLSKTISSQVGDKNSIIAIGASTGGTEALQKVLKDLPTNLPGIVITQHMPAGFTNTFASRLNSSSIINVKEAEHGDKVLPGFAYIAPGDFHMKVLRKNGESLIYLEQTEKVSGHRPSVDVLFSSIAESFKEKSLGVILTGMGKDGAVGMKKMRDAGAHTLGQDKDSSIVYGMPQEAYLLGGVEKQLSLDNIPNAIISNFLK